MFKVGDIVRGTNHDRYGVTNTKMRRARVTRIDKKYQSFGVVILEHVEKEHIGNEFTGLLPDYFELVETKKESNPTVVEASIINTKLHANGKIKTIRIGDVTLAIQSEASIGIAIKHPDDENSDLVGEAIAIKRFLDEVVG